MSPVVIDASIAVRWFIPDEREPESDALFQRLISLTETAHVPPHFFVEVFSALYQATQEGRFPEQLLSQVIPDLKQYPIVINEPSLLWKRAADLGKANRISGGQAIDLVYLALADLLELPF